MTDHEPTLSPGDEEATALLLRLAGSRSDVPASRAGRVRSAVHAEWEKRSRRQTVRRRVVFGSAALAAAALVLIAARFVTFDGVAIRTGDPTAVVHQVVGTPQRVPEGSGESRSGQLAPNDVVRIGEWIETDARARVGLRFSNGTSVRLDAASRMRPLSPSEIELSAGAVYIDTGSESARFAVLTPLATAHDLGTQFEVRLLDDTLRLRVRSGIVELKDGVRSVSGRAGTEITLSSIGAVSRPFATHGAEWDWTAALSPALDSEGMSLAAFLERLAREHGWVVHYSDSTLAREAAGITLHGSIEGLPASQAAETAIATSGLHHRLENGTLMVVRQPSAR